MQQSAVPRLMIAALALTFALPTSMHAQAVYGSIVGTVSDSSGAILAGAGFGVALVSGVAALLAGLGVRWGWWDYGSGFLILTCAVWSGLTADLSGANGELNRSVSGWQGPQFRD